LKIEKYTPIFEKDLVENRVIENILKEVK